MVTQEKLKRINELANKSKTSGLTEAEKQEQMELRKEYIASARSNLEAQLKSIRIKDQDKK